MKWENWISPINLISQDIETYQEGEVLKAVAKVGVDIDKDELIKCIQYDRNQYEKGYQQGRADGIRELRDLLLCMFDTYRSNGFNFDAERFLLNQLKEQENEQT